MAEVREVIRFDNWLKETLIQLNTDDEIFSPYIKGILEGEETYDEKTEALKGIISEITEDHIIELCSEIIRKWNFSQSHSNDKEEKPTEIGVDEKLSRLMVEQAQCLVTTKSRSTEDEKLRSAILANYSQVSDGDESDVGIEEGGGATGGRLSAGCSLARNTNAEDVSRTEREKRDKDKEESHKRKEKDKEDRAKQKEEKDDRKDKEKKRTQKGERKR